MGFFRAFSKEKNATIEKMTNEKNEINDLLAPNGNVPSNELLTELLNFQHMTGEEFEDLLARLLRNAGYLVSLTKKSNDYGIDLVVRRHESEPPLYLIQAKKRRHGQKQYYVTREMVEKTAGGKEIYRAPNAKICIITTGYFDGPALRYAEKANILTLNFKDIFLFITANNPTIIYDKYLELTLQSGKPEDAVNQSTVKPEAGKMTCSCENCGNVLAVKKGRNYSYFLGCANYEKEKRKKAFTVPKCVHCGKTLQLVKFRNSHQFAFVCPDNKTSEKCKSSFSAITNTF
ncbi:restriction endonuclease [Candidatus Enterococcus clewellii]|uniref:Restriction endonuclease type IV Mrr domain-containing protein n=1 Tax=Candidatus Enterococcus clewellii TaxID=1834193 RepID=A0AAQ3W2Y7_9ENTE